jgi:Flp pilus assembly pilin Flp
MQVRSAPGQGLVEYGLILGGSALVTVITLVFLGPVLAEILSLIGEAIDAATSGAYGLD